MFCRIANKSCLAFVKLLKTLPKIKLEKRTRLAYTDSNVPRHLYICCSVIVASDLFIKVCFIWYLRSVSIGLHRFLLVDRHFCIAFCLCEFGSFWLILTCKICFGSKKGRSVRTKSDVFRVVANNLHLKYILRRAPIPGRGGGTPS